MKSKSILEEIRRIRDEHAKEFNCDLDAIYSDIKRHERELEKRGWKFMKSPNQRSSSGKRVA